MLALQQPIRTDNTISEPVKSGGLAGLDRKAMEQERLARLAGRKREAPISPPRLQQDRPEKRVRTTVATPKVCQYFANLPITRNHTLCNH
jgi:hypothetical protein